MTHDQDICRVRIAPSPTGYLHVGTARTALFNYLYAKGHNGRFILRIEDTDRERSEEQYTRNIYESLRVLGLAWDEGPDIGGPFAPYAQSQRLPIYREWADKLAASGHAYPCYHTQAELDVEREQARQEKRPYVYSGLCRDVQARQALAEKPTDDGSARQPSLRFRIPDNRGALAFTDCVRGQVSFDTALLGDFVILKSDGTPSYNFAVVVDDILMKITQVIRGEDHLSNTPRQILLYEAFGVSPPEFAHVGMILAPDRTKLSKRHGAVAVSDYIRQGYLPEAFCNFLALLGWSPPDGEEIGTLEHFARQFELDRITHSPAIFELDKLNFLNGRLIRSLPLPELLERARSYLRDFDLTQYPPEKLYVMLDAVREPLTTLGELSEAVDYFFASSIMLTPRQIEENLAGPEPARVLDAFEKNFLPSADFSSPETVAAHLKTWSQSLKPLKPRVVMGSLRLAVTGRMQGADLSKTLYILGPETLRRRIQAALALTVDTIA